jgi:RNA polymerase subunit RPABC4/transcription elongation factor Spt4
MRDSLFTIPRVTPFVECPHCKRLIEYGISICPSCREEISPDYAKASAIKVIVNTQACGLANTIRTAERALIVVFVSSLLGFLFLDSSLLIISLLTPVIHLAAVLLWLRYYRNFRGDEEYGRARARMWASFRLWAVLLLVQLLAVAYLWREGH